MSVRNTVRGAVRSSVIGTLRRGAIGVNKNMVLVMATTGAAETVTIPCQNVGTFNATINWGDGTADSTITAWNDADLAHVYAGVGDHTITISGTFPNVYFNAGGDVLKLKEITNLGATGLTRLDQAFKSASNLTSVTGYADTSAIITLNGTFNGCTSLTVLDVSGWDIGSVTILQQAFDNLPLLTTLDVSGFDTSNVTNMYRAFNNFKGTALDVSGWDTSNVTAMSQLFANAPNLTDLEIDGWAIEAVTNLSNFMNLTTLPTSRYDAILIAWDAQNPIDSLSANFGSSKYTSGGAAETARSNLVTTDLWTITDGGPA